MRLKRSDSSDFTGLVIQLTTLSSTLAEVADSAVGVDILRAAIMGYDKCKRPLI